MNGQACRPCARLYPLLQESAAPLLPAATLAGEFTGEVGCWQGACGLRGWQEQRRCAVVCCAAPLGGWQPGASGGRRPHCTMCCTQCCTALQGLALLKRTENEGMDFAAHNVTLSWMAAQGRLG